MVNKEAVRTMIQVGKGAPLVGAFADCAEECLNEVERLEQALASARSDALEEAAKICELVATQLNILKSDEPMPRTTAKIDALKAMAILIRGRESVSEPKEGK